MLLFLATLAHAAPALTPAEQTTRDALLARFDAHFEHAAETEGPDGCLTPLVAELKQSWHLFDAGERARITGVLAPWKADLAAPVAAARPRTDASRASLADSCVGQQKANRLEGEHFVVEWDDDVDDRYAPRFLEALEYSYGIETDDLGWRKPAGDGRYLMPAYIERGNYQGAYTTVEQCGSGYYPYIVAYSGSWADASWADTMAAHEFNHAIQFSYGFAHEFWWWEATATYVEDSVYDSDWWAYYVTGYADSPHVAMNASDQQNQEIFWHMYGMAIWNFHIHENLGGMSTVLDIWESGRDERGTYTWGQEDAFEELGLDFRATYLDFIVRNVSMDYVDHRILPEVDTVGNVRELPASGAGEGGTRPQGYGQNYVRIAGGLGTGTLELDFTSDEGVAWAVGLVETDGREVLRSSVQVIDALGAGTVTLEDYATNDVYLVVSPLVDGSAKRDYAWTLALVAPPVEEDPVVDPADEAGDETVIKGGCGCATGSLPGVPLTAAAVGAAALLARRRRTRA
jgi:hypothetical protein